MSSFSKNTIKIFIWCNENIQITDVFVALDENIYGIHNKRVNILYLFYMRDIFK